MAHPRRPRYGIVGGIYFGSMVQTGLVIVGLLLPQLDSSGQQMHRNAGIVLKH